ncbi:tektin-B1 isoform X2 [Odontomachus brunneus]|uniref:tektin-B1 isoform X2 n=1 Tax=Odontomachus brunneus TaxID=486640 RepID=UPI0013F1ADB0|nr:tektin-B1 isoform X2 [Odontomachus brunneus]
MAKFVSTYEKPLPHISLPDWYATQWELRQSSDAQRSEAHRLRDFSKSVRLETDVRTKWDININNDRLADRVQTAWEKLNSLESVKFDLSVDTQDKNETIKIDKENLELDRTCANISYKPIGEKTHSITYTTWLDRCRGIKALADDKLSDSYSFRETTRVMREHSWNDIRAQQDATDYTLRKRIYQTQKARNELDWQKLKVQKEMEVLKKEITRLEGALTSKIDVVKCAQTRLENRAYRPGYELCKDDVETGLWSEVLQLKQTKENLNGAIESAKTSYNSLESLLTRIDHDLDDKQHSMNIDIMCLDSRSILKTGDRARLSNETDRNIVLTRMEKELPLES